MVKGKYKFIKDGAYSIKVEETESNIVKVEKEKKYDSDGDEIEDDDNENDILFQNVEEQPVELEELIDYQDTNFILQNLKLSLPDVTEDKTFLLNSREEQAKILCSQIRFYLYCALTAFTKEPKNVSILIIGEGYMGTNVINELIDIGCRDMLKIFSRGDVTSEEWQLKGLKASNNIKELLNGVQPDIIIITVENVNFNIICKQLLSNHLINEASFVISCSFGFQRAKLCALLNTMSIFRTFVEPQEVVDRFKQESLNKIASMIDPNGISAQILKSFGTPSPKQKRVSISSNLPNLSKRSINNSTSFSGSNTIDNKVRKDSILNSSSKSNSILNSYSKPMGSSFIPSINNNSSRPSTSEQIITSAIEAANASYNASLTQEGDNYFSNTHPSNLEFNNLEDSQLLPPLNITITNEPNEQSYFLDPMNIDHTDLESISAQCLGNRIIHMKHIIYQLENYYCIVRKYEPEEARYKAVLNVLGIAKEEFLKEMNEDEQCIEDAIILRSKATNENRNLEEELEKMQKQQNSFANLTLRRRIKAQLKIKHKLEYALKSIYEKGINKYQEHFQYLLTRNDIYELIKQDFIKEPEIIFDKKNRKRPVTAPLYGKPMYEMDFMMDIFKYDDEYNHLMGTHPVYNLMAYYDGKIDHFNEDEILHSNSMDSLDDIKQPTNNNNKEISLEIKIPK